ncbi:hypothetical protein KTO58_23905 [Chitinophaga pendula]|uniref:hypothetical protein n=1 Tax=Chitinophaga TaxID=79328 RepID=UPI0018E05E45|nr:MULTISPECIES: hypothetical protein [Chitinophaga]UCJ06678.1 hypothetical protein KTO58_23905 [Chitinophaga pendula]
MKDKQPKNEESQVPGGQRQDKPQPPTAAEQEQRHDELFPGYPSYPKGEDITSRNEEVDMDVEDATRSTQLNDEILRERQRTAREDMDEGLDVPGAELDDADEETGGEDEENNFYSLGGDRHED